ncbi:MAG: Vitamin B12 import ATP-binding protein BtuD [Gemmatimonadaceae bacterium]|nr:Vitamin B12 import ATP-binding protein BtuD [Gemmatimonadaceae bacterium]
MAGKMQPLRPESGDVVARLNGVSKRYPVRRTLRDTLIHPRGRAWAQVLSDIACEVHAGEFFGLLGPNGAGKTTLLKILATLVLPDEGTASVAGFDVGTQGDAVRASVSPCLASERSLYWRLTARENLRLAADLLGVPKAVVGERIAESLSAVGLDDTGTKMVGQYSSGMMQRLLIARALLSRPRLLLLDEPTRSLDPLSAREFRRFLRAELVQRRGCAVLLATHSADEAFELCDRVAIMDRGRLLAQGVATELASRYLGARYRLVTPKPDHEALGSVLLASHAQTLKRAEEGGGLAAITVKLLDGDSSAPAVLSALVHAGIPVARFEQVPLALADLIESVVSGQDVRAGVA